MKARSGTGAGFFIFVSHAFYKTTPEWARSGQGMRIGRRAVLFGAALWATQARATEAGPVRLRLWPGVPPGGGGPTGPERSDGGNVTNVSDPALTVYVPPNPNGTAMLVAAGGGYQRISMTGEAAPAVRWLTARGIIACVLTYRLPQEGWAVGPLAPLQDAQRAIRMMRAGRASAAIDPDRIGLLGVSAGGHLMGMTAARSDEPSYAPVDEVDRQSAEVATAALIYPVITLLPPFDRTATRISLVGTNPNLQQAMAWSVQTHVDDDTPPIFVVETQDDPIAKPENGEILADACEDAQVPVQRLLLPRGGHGFAMGRTGSPSEKWPAFLETWLRARRLL